MKHMQTCASILRSVKWNIGRISRVPFETRNARPTTQSPWYSASWWRRDRTGCRVIYKNIHFRRFSAVFHWKDCRIEIKALLLQQQIPPRLFSMRTRAELLLFIHYGLYKTTVGLSPDSSNVERTGADCQGWDWSLAPVKNHKLLPFGKLYASDGGG